MLRRPPPKRYTSEHRNLERQDFSPRSPQFACFKGTWFMQRPENRRSLHKTYPSQPCHCVYKVPPLQLICANLPASDVRKWQVFKKPPLHPMSKYFSQVVMEFGISSYPAFCLLHTTWPPCCSSLYNTCTYTHVFTYIIFSEGLDRRPTLYVMHPIQDMYN